VGTALEIIDFFGIPQHGGCLTLLCSWQVGPELKRHVQDDMTSLATHVHDARGALLLFDGPRSSAVRADGRVHEMSVPLVVPMAVGTYLISIDAVVEGKFWASSLGVTPVQFHIERLPDGGLVGAVAGQSNWFYVMAQRRFRIPHPLYGRHASERVVEIPWVLSRYRGEHRVLDIGYAYAASDYLALLSELGASITIGLDVAVGTGIDLRVVADVRRPALLPASIDLILAISVIEHIGRDNQQYFRRPLDGLDSNADFEAVRSLAALLRPNGTLLLTVPFGNEENHGWFIQYNSARLHALLQASGLVLIDAEFFQYRNGWQGPVSPNTLAHSCYRVDAHSASAIACVALSRSE